jgi:RimJ/RimL family protein N-acetyltransferase
VGEPDHDEADGGEDADLVPVHLRDGTPAVVVPLLPANREALRQEYERLSAETRFDRFLSAVPELTDTMLDHLVDDVDGVDHVALVLLVTTDDGTELPLGLARIVRYPHDPAAADVAVTVVDDWHGRGVATALLEVLMRRRPPGVERIVTVVQADNRASVAMLARLGPVEVGDPESGTRRVVVDLSGATSRKDPGDRAGTAQESAASRSNPGRVWVDSRSRAASRAADCG